jgi:hypothetical protein
MKPRLKAAEARKALSVARSDIGRLRLMVKARDEEIRDLKHWQKPTKLALERVIKSFRPKKRFTPEETKAALDALDAAGIKAEILYTFWFRPFIEEFNSVDWR